MIYHIMLGPFFNRICVCALIDVRVVSKYITITQIYE